MENTTFGKGWEQGFHNARLFRNNKRIPLYLAANIGVSAGCHLKLIVGSLEKGVFLLARSFNVKKREGESHASHATVLIITQSPVTPKLSCLQPWDYSRGERLDKWMQ